MKEEDRIKLWLALYEEGEVMDGECYMGEITLKMHLDKFGVPDEEREREILMLLAWGVIEKLGPSEYRRNKSWKPSLGMLFLDKMDAMELNSGKISQEAEERERDKMRKYKCTKCGKPLIEGLEYQFPPRLSYWYCSTCQTIFKETDKGVVEFYGDVEGNERLCVQDEEIRGFIQEGDGRRAYPDTF